MRGTWTRNTDSVFLNVHYNEYRSDSLKRTGEKADIPTRPISYKIKTKGRGEILLYRDYNKTIELLKKQQQ